MSRLLMLHQKSIRPRLIPKTPAKSSHMEIDSDLSKPTPQFRGAKKLTMSSVSNSYSS
ncbi:MAG: hypothetical protein RAK21_06210 [Synechococcus sp. SP2 MAG]|nr:hypothetical protein [Synechococcus sp. SP2 MAG]